MTNYRPNWKTPKPNKLLLEEKQLETLFLKEGTAIALTLHSQGDIFIEDETKKFVYKVAALRAIVCFGRVNIEGWALNALLRAEVPVVLFDREGQLLGRIEPQYGDRPDILRSQANISDAQRLHLAQMAVWGLLRKWRTFLRKHQNSYGTDFSSEARDLNFCVEGIFKATAIAEVVGLLGRGSQLYYQSLPRCLRYSGWEWQGREVATPLNQMLNFGYSLLQETAISAIASAGLDPAIGTWHSSPRQRNALASDLAAEFRWLTDAVVVRCVNQGRVGLKDFDEGGDRLPPRVVKVLADSFEKKLSERFKYPEIALESTYLEALYLQARQIALYLSGQIEEYAPLELR